MRDTKYTKDQLDKLKSQDVALARSEEEKYADYKSIDPFPDVEAALLNSSDLLMYLLTVGIVEPFNVENIKGVTYACTFSGEAHKFNSQIGRMEEINLTGDEELILEQNSITYLKLEEKFRVPEYMVLRFNLSVSNAYKGVLLGTGPIVDPGFEGNLFIPLHNLTGNKYVIKKGASLIRVEFTKLSAHTDWLPTVAYGKTIFESLKPITKITPRDVKFSTSIEDALLDLGNRKFFKRDSSDISVRSSIPDAIAESAEQAEKSAKYANKLKNFGLAGIVGVLLSIAGLFLASFQLISDTNARYDAMYQLVDEYKALDRENQDTVSALQERIALLEISNKKQEITLLMTEYASFTDKSSITATEVYEEILKLTNEIAELEKQYPQYD